MSDSEPTRSPRLAVATVAYGTFLATITGSAIRVAFPSIVDGLDASWAGIQWVSMVFLLTVTSLLATTGRLGDLYGLKRFYAGGQALYVLASALCAAAWSLESLIAFRLLQATGSAMTAAMGPALIATVSPPHQRGRSMGWIGTAVAVGVSAGPPIGGLLLELGSWRYVFLINLPLGVIGVTAALVLLPRAKRAGPRPQFDVLGSLLLGAGFALLLLGLSQGRTWGWSSVAIMSLLAAGSVLLAGFVSWETRAPAPMLPLSLFRSRVFASAVSSALLLYMSIIGVSFLVVFFLTDGLGLTGWRLGLVMAAQPLGSALTSPFSGRLSDRIGSRPLTVAGTLLAGVSYLLLAWLCAEGDPWLIAAPLALTGVAAGTFGSPNSSAILCAAPKEYLGVAGGVLATARTLGMATGVAIAGAAFGHVFAGGTGGLEMAEYRAEHLPALVAGLRTVLGIATGMALAALVVAALRGSDLASRAEASAEPPLVPGE